MATREDVETAMLEGLNATGVVVVGVFEGVKPPKPYTRDDGTDGMSRPKIGIRDRDGVVYSITCSEVSFVEWNTRQRGEAVMVPVTVRPPFGSPRGAGVRFVLAGDETSDGASWE